MEPIVHYVFPILTGLVLGVSTRHLCNEVAVVIIPDLQIRDKGPYTVFGFPTVRGCDFSLSLCCFGCGRYRSISSCRHRIALSPPAKDPKTVP